MEIYKDLSSPASKEFKELLNSQLSKSHIEEGKIIEGKINKITEKDLTPLSVLVRKFSKDMPIVYSLFSIFFAIALGVAAAFIRRFLSDLKKKHFSKPAK